ncbi:MAG: circularly permuted type 2 ATP-grasp protein, partial [Verrucomicrobiales bacterium]
MPGSMRQFQSSGPPPTADSELMASYRPISGRFDESHSDSWRALYKELHVMGPEGLRSAWKRGQDLLNENGIAYNLLSEDDNSDRRWALDPIPLALSESEWNTLATAAIQRAKLWDKILHDCYGPRTLLNRGLIPPALLFSQPNYQHSLRGLASPNTPLLSFYAVDIARDPNGQWTVVADRTESPNGAGFALENRIVLNNVYPGATKRLHLLRFASYFQKMRDSLFARVSSAIESPRVVMLSPGTGDATYFEDAYLSRYLGITLAIGEELTVRNERLYLKTVSGLQPVHILIRRVAENEADPLESPSRSSQGIPGLFQAMRAGSVVVLNPPGTGITEAAAFLPFLPAISRDLLGEDLLLPSIPTRWGSQTEGLELAQQPGSVVKSAFTRNLFPPKLTRDLTAVQVRELGRAIATAPEKYVVQDEMRFSCAPCWNGSTMEARPVAIRMMLFSDGKDYHVMPGGLVRSAATPETLPGLSLHEDSCSKDLWILSNSPKPALTPSNLPNRLNIRRAQGILSSRAADNMLWIGRYSERAEYATRVILEIIHSLIDESDAPVDPSIRILISTLDSFDYLQAQVAKSLLETPDREKLFTALIPAFYSQPNQQGAALDSLPANLSRLRNLSSLSRDRLSAETWRIVGLLDDAGRAKPARTLPGFRRALQHAILLHSSF